MPRIIRLMLAFLGFLPLAAISVACAFAAYSEIVDPLLIVSGHLARQNPPALAERIVMAMVYSVLAFGAFVAAGLVAAWGVSNPSESPSDSETNGDRDI